MATRLARELSLIVFLWGYSVLGQADTMIRTRTVITDSVDNPQVANPSITRNVQYRHGNMRKEENLGTGTTPSIENIANCETKTGFLIDLSAHEYRTYKVVRFASKAQRSEYLQKTGKSAVQLESQTVDTGERRVFFGHQAKHLITNTKRREGKITIGEEIIDGWYIDHELPDRHCAPDFVRSEEYYLIGTALVDYPDMAEFHHVGPLPAGLAVKLKVTHRAATTKDGGTGRTITVEKIVEDLSDAPLSDSLFELPKGFRENPALLGGHAVPRPLPNQ